MSNSQSSTDASSPPVRRLYRSQQQKILGGVCGGLAEYFNVDVTLVRLLWILVTLIGGAGILAYIIAWIIVPVQPGHGTVTPPRNSSAGTVLGVILVIVGVILLASWSGVYIFAFPWQMHWFFFPGILIVLGLGLLLGWLLSRPGTDVKDITIKPAADESTDRETPARLYRSRDQRIISGICGGFGLYLNIDPVIIRILWTLFAVASLGMALLIYVILVFVIPEEPITWGDHDSSK